MARPILQDLALVLCVAAVTTVVFRRLRQPVVLGYLLAGLIVGPHLPSPILADPQRIHTLSELGVILVMFSVGLDLSVRRFLKVVPTAGLTGLVQIGLMIWLGYLAGQAMGWTVRESLFCGAIVAISSTMIVTKVFAELRIRGRLADIVFGVLVIEDLAAILLLALLATVSSTSGGGISGSTLAVSLGRLGGFLVGLVAVGFLLVPRAIRLVARLNSPETLLVASIGLCFAFALLAHKLGYSVALGAFLAGSLVAESGEGGQVEHLVRSVRDIFAAVFFVSVGMLVDPAMILRHFSAVLLLTAVVLVGQTLSVSLGSFLSGNGVRTSIQAGMSLAQTGEFSFIIAGTGVATGAVGEFLYPVAVAVSVLTTFSTPWLVRVSQPVALFVDRHLPRRLQSFVALYGSWVEQARSGGRCGVSGRASRLVCLIAVDAAIIAAIVIGTSLSLDRLMELASAHTRIHPSVAELIVMIAAVLLCVPFFLGMVRCARALGHTLAAAALPPAPEGKVDLAAAPRRALVVTLQLAMVLIVGIPLLALTQPFVPALYGAIVLFAILGLLGVAFWRSAENLEEHVRAGAQAIVEVLANQAGDSSRPSLLQVQPLLPGFGDLTPITLRATSPATGKTLAEINLRGLTGATVVAITRGGSGILPTGKEPLQTDDVLVVAGAHEAIDAARRLLLGSSGGGQRRITRHGMRSAR
ncbi:MAG: cation:proton antiporter [Pseudomonadota bacterium]